MLGHVSTTHQLQQNQVLQPTTYDSALPSLSAADTFGCQAGIIQTSLVGALLTIYNGWVIRALVVCLRQPSMPTQRRMVLVMGIVFALFVAGAVFYLSR